MFSDVISSQLSAERRRDLRAEAGRAQLRGLARGCRRSALDRVLRRPGAGNCPNAT